MAQLIAEKSNLIAVGSWNPAIIQPAWLRKEFPEIIPPTFNIELTGPLVSVRYDFGFCLMTPAANRLLFIPKTVDVDTLVKIAALGKGIYERLKYTPIAAAGCNFFFQLDKNEKFKSEEIEMIPDISNLPQKLVKSELTSRTISHTFSKDDFNINVTYEISGIERFLIINFDYQHPQQALVMAANSFVDNFGCANELANNLIRNN